MPPGSLVYNEPVTRESLDWVYRGGRYDAAAIENLRLQGQWIWGAAGTDEKQPAAGEQLVFRKAVKLSAEVVSGSFVMTADNAFDQLPSADK